MWVRSFSRSRGRRDRTVRKQRKGSSLRVASFLWGPFRYPSLRDNSFGTKMLRSYILRGCLAADQCTTSGLGPQLLFRLSSWNPQARQSSSPVLQRARRRWLWFCGRPWQEKYGHFRWGTYSFGEFRAVTRYPAI